MTSDEQATAYGRDGFIIVRRVFSDEDLFAWKRVVNEMLRADEAEGRDNSGGVRVWYSKEMDPRLLSAMCDARIIRVLNCIIGPDIEFLSAKIVFKSAKTTFGTPWHQDWYYWFGSPKISAWIPLDDCTPDNGALRVVPGTHKIDHITNARTGEHGFTNCTPPEQIESLPVVDVVVGRGDIVFFSDKCVHGSYPNLAGADRFAFIPTYRDASIYDDSSAWPSAILCPGESRG